MKYNEFKLSFYNFFSLYLAYQAVGRLNWQTKGRIMWKLQC